MKRRTHLRAMLGALASWRITEAQTPRRTKPIQLFVEMAVEPHREKEMLDNFHNIFLPEARKHPGYISVKLLKLRQVVQGPAPDINYRFELVYESEELRQKWIATPEHQRVWPTVERTLKSTKNYPVLLFDEV
jgi:heme-degrading monooxygenase HmoA